MAAAGPRRRKVIGHRRRVEDEGEEEAGPEALDLDDDSLTDGSIASDEHDLADDSDTSNVDEMSPTSPNAQKSVGNGAAKPGFRRTAKAVSGEKPTVKQVETAVADNEMMLNRLSLADKDEAMQELSFDDAQRRSAKDAAPIVVSSSPVPKQQGRVPIQELKRREHEEYRRKRDEDPTFVPNRGAFFLHDHRHAGPAANGFRPFPRGARGRGRGAFGGPFAPVKYAQCPTPPSTQRLTLIVPSSQLHNVSDPTTNGPWAHDMHEAVAEPPAHRQARYLQDHEGPLNGNGIVPTAPPSKTPINRAMSTERHVANVNVRVYIPLILAAPRTFPGVPLKQYTKLPDHRPPLRRDKPVRISLPDHEAPLMPRYIYPANDRSFIFIPRAMRPNQQRVRGKGPRSTMGGSVGPFSRRTSVFGSYYGSVYSPSIAMSRRSSIAPDIGREFLISPTGSAISRPPLPMDNSRPVVRLPPLAQPPVASMPMPTPPDASDKPVAAVESSISDLPQPQTHPLPQKPTFQENRPNSIPMHQPRPQKTVSVENIESPVQQAMNAPPPYQQAFNHQLPPQMSSPYTHDAHVRNPSYMSQPASATPGPLSQIPERAIHAAPFQPNTYSQPGFYGQPYPMMQQPQQGYYYPQQYGANMAPNANAPAFVPAAQQTQPVAYNPAGQADVQAAQANGQAGSAQGLIVQEMNGTYYFYDPNQLNAMAGLPSYPAAQQYNPGMVGMSGMVTPSPDGFYYPQTAPGMVYFAP